MILERVFRNWFGIPSIFRIFMIFSIFQLPKIIIYIYIYICVCVESSHEYITASMVDFSRSQQPCMGTQPRPWHAHVHTAQAMATQRGHATKAVAYTLLRPWQPRMGTQPSLCHARRETKLSIKKWQFKKKKINLRPNQSKMN